MKKEMKQSEKKAETKTTEVAPQAPVAVSAASLSVEEKMQKLLNYLKTNAQKTVEKFSAGLAEEKFAWRFVSWESDDLFRASSTLQACTELETTCDAEGNINMENLESYLQTSIWSLSKSLYNSTSQFHNIHNQYLLQAYLRIHNELANYRRGMRF